MLRCENCGKEHDGTYGSGRFCSSKCARGFSTKAKRKEINKKVSISLKGNIPWHRGLTDVYSKNTKKNISNTLKKYFELHPGESSRRLYNRPVTIETRKKISLSNVGKTGGYREKGGRGKSGYFNGIYCNSSWELAYLIYCRDYNINVTRNKEGFHYNFENKKFRYYPDFILDDKIYVEVKGYKDKRYNDKISQFPYKLEIIDKEKIDSYLKYVIEKYGKNFIELYEEKSKL